MEKENQIICDECSSIIEQQKDFIKQRVIARDENNEDIIETYFMCEHCGKSYTVTVTDRQMRLWIQHRRTLMVKMARLNIQRKKNQISVKDYLKKRDKLAAEDHTYQLKLAARGGEIRRKYKED